MIDAKDAILNARQALNATKPSDHEREVAKAIMIAEGLEKVANSLNNEVLV